MKVTKNENGTVELAGELSVETLLKYEKDALGYLGKEVSLPGFRKGHVPPDTLKKHLDASRIMHEIANRALARELPKIFADEKLVPIGKPNVTVTKLAAGNPLGFKVHTAVLPEIELPDYKKIAAEEKLEENIEVSDKDIEDAIKEIQTRVAHAEYHQKNPDDKNHNHGDLPLPKLDDELVNKLGGYENVDDFKTKIREQIKGHKTLQAREKHRMSIIERILSEVSVAMPDVLAEAELQKMSAQFKADVERVGMKFDDYLKQIKKNEEDLRREWKPDAIKRAKTQLVLNKVAQTENITPDTKQIDREVSNILSSHKEANKTAVTIFVTTQLTNELVFQFLENQINTG